MTDVWNSSKKFHCQMELFYHLRVGEKIAESYNKIQLALPNCIFGK